MPLTDDNGTGDESQTAGLDGYSFTSVTDNTQDQSFAAYAPNTELESAQGEVNRLNRKFDTAGFIKQAVSSAAGIAGGMANQAIRDDYTARVDQSIIEHKDAVQRGNTAPYVAPKMGLMEMASRDRSGMKTMAKRAVDQAERTDALAAISQAEQTVSREISEGKILPAEALKQYDALLQSNEAFDKASGTTNGGSAIFVKARGALKSQWEQASYVETHRTNFESAVQNAVKVPNDANNVNAADVILSSPTPDVNAINAAVAYIDTSPQNAIKQIQTLLAVDDSEDRLTMETRHKLKGMLSDLTAPAKIDTAHRAQANKLFIARLQEGMARHINADTSVSENIATQKYMSQFGNKLDLKTATDIELSYRKQYQTLTKSSNKAVGLAPNTSKAERYASFIASPTGLAKNSDEQNAKWQESNADFIMSSKLDPSSKMISLLDLNAHYKELKGKSLPQVVAALRTSRNDVLAGIPQDGIKAVMNNPQYMAMLDAGRRGEVSLTDVDRSILTARGAVDKATQQLMLDTALNAQSDDNIKTESDKAIYKSMLSASREIELDPAPGHIDRLVTDMFRGDTSFNMLSADDRADKIVEARESLKPIGQEVYPQTADMAALDVVQAVGLLNSNGNRPWLSVNTSAAQAITEDDDAYISSISNATSGGGFIYVIDFADSTRDSVVRTSNDIAVFSEEQASKAKSLGNDRKRKH